MCGRVLLGLTFLVTSSFATRCAAQFGVGDTGVAIVRVGELCERSNLDGSNRDFFHHAKVLSWLKKPQQAPEVEVARNSIVHFPTALCGRQFGKFGYCKGDVLLVDVEWADRELRSDGGELLADADAFTRKPAEFSVAELAHERRGFEAALHIREAASDHEKVDRILAAARFGDSVALRSEVRLNLFGELSEIGPEEHTRLRRLALELAVSDEPARDRWWLWHSLRFTVPRYYRAGDPRHRLPIRSDWDRLTRPTPEWDRAFRGYAGEYARIVLPTLRAMVTCDEIDEVNERSLLRVARDFVPFLGQDDPSSPLLEGLRPLLLEYSEHRCEDDEVVRLIETIVERTWED